MLRPVLALCLAVLSSIPAQAQVAPRLPTRLTIPTVIVSSPEVVNDMRTWKNLLQNDMSALAAELSMLSSADRIAFREQSLASAPTLAAIDNRWRQENAIQVVTAVGSRLGASTVLEGSVYLGDLAGTLSPKMVALPATVDAKSYQSSRDIVKVATLYALAIDARNYRPAACQLLRRAQQVRDDLSRRNSMPVALAAAIGQRVTALKCGIVR